MFIRARNPLFVMIICCSFVTTAYTGQSLEAATKQLRTLEAVTGSAVGTLAIPGDFYVLSKDFIQKGMQEDFIKLTEDENPVARSMGLFCLAKNKKSVNILKQHITDSDVITYFPGGCIGWTVTVGNFARELLYNANCLDYDEPNLPVLSKEQLTGLDIEILAMDSTSSFHDDSAKTLSEIFTGNQIVLTMPVLKKYASELESYQIIKAIGRLGVSPQQREFLISCVRDESLDGLSRLAAASALTRDANETVLSVIESERIRLNNLSQDNLGDRFLETIQNRISHEKLMKTSRGLTWQNKEDIYNAVLTAFSNSHPLALPDLTNDRFLWLEPDDDNICNVAGDSLVEMSKNLEQFNQPWNTYSDTAYALSFMIPRQEGGPQIDDVFTPIRRSEIKKNVEKAIANHFEVNKH